MRFRILGPLEVNSGQGWQPISADKWRSLLACLLLRPGQIVSTDALAQELWGDAQPAKAKNLISIYVLRVRRLIGDFDGRVISWRSPGYVLNLADGDLDSQRFDSLVADGRQALAGGDPAWAAELLAGALGLWRGPLLADVPQSPLLELESERAVELRLAATELWVQAELECGRFAEVIPELRRLVGEHPIREGAWLLLMRALRGAGRPAEALSAYAAVRRVLADELGTDPGAELQAFYAELLTAPAPPSPAPPPVVSSGAGAAVAGDLAATAAAGSLPPVTEGAAPAADGRGPAGKRPAGEAGRPGAGRPGADRPGADRDAEAASLTDPPGRIAMGTISEAPRTPAAPPAAMAADSPVPLPAQLPADIGDFTGREEHVGQLCDMLTKGAAAGSPGAVAIAVVAGAGGLGKTTLAVHAAHQIRDQFPDGQLYVDLFGATLHPMAPGEVLARFLRDLGVAGDKVPAGDEERAALYRTRLTGRRVLIVLDNARDAAQVRPLLPGSASCAVLVTTRNRTADLASTRFVDLNVLADDDALALFTRILGEGDGRAAAEADATAEVLLACAGLPLAVRICAARLAARRHWKIATMASRLRDVRRRLDELRVGDLEVRACFQVSYDSLGKPRYGADPRRVFRLLGLWQGPSVSLPAAAALLGEPEDKVADALEALVDANLLESSGEDCYRFHDLLRFYATERAEEEESGEARHAAMERLLRWYLGTAEAAAEINSPNRYHMPPGDLGNAVPLRFRTAAEALAWYDGERANVVAATRQAAAMRIDHVGWRLPAALLTVFNRRSNWADCVTTHRIALECVRRAGSRQGEGWVLNNLGLAFTRTRDAEAIVCLEGAREIRRDIADAAGELQAAVNLASAYYSLRGPRLALKPMQECLELARESGLPSRHAEALNNLGDVYRELGRLDEAADCFRRATDIVQGTGDTYIAGHAMHNLGEVYLDTSRMDEALNALRKAVSIHQSSGDQVGEAFALKFLGRAQRGLGKTAEARESWTTALGIFTDHGEKDQADEVESELASL